MQILGSVVAIIVALVVCPISGVGSSAAAATEALYEMEQAAMALRDGVLTSLATAGGAAAAATGQSPGQSVAVSKGGSLERPEGNPPPQQADTPQSSSSSCHWTAAREALGRAEACCVRMAVKLSSVTAYPVSLVLGKGSQGNQLLLQLCSMAPALPKALQVGALDRGSSYGWWRGLRGRGNRC